MCVDSDSVAINKDFLRYSQWSCSLDGVCISVLPGFDISTALSSHHVQGNGD